VTRYCLKAGDQGMIFCLVIGHDAETCRWYPRSDPDRP
jgi:hypothetical protein